MRSTLLLAAATAALMLQLTLPCVAIEKETKKGPVTVTVRVTPDEPRIGDDLSMTIEVVAEDGVEVLMPSYGESLERFSILRYLPNESIDDSGRAVTTHDYVLQPPFSGKQFIPELLIEFVDRRPGQKPHPDGEDAYEILTERLAFEVQSVVPADAAPEMKPPIGELAKLLPPPPPRWPWLVGVLAVLLLASPFAIRGFLHWRRLARRRSAYDIAATKLQRLLTNPHPAAGEVDAFFVELSAIVRRYLEDRFDLRAPELTTEEFLDICSQSPDMNSEHQKLLRDFLRGADLVKFAHHVPSSQDIDGTVSAVRRFLEETRENAPLLDVDEEAATTAARAEGSNV
ncbi:MAG: DUF4381 family protein [Planctomycetota bacterium]